jgi:hypothetical protein
MSTKGQKPVAPIDMNAPEPEHIHPPEDDSGSCLPGTPRAAHLRAIHARVQANDYVVQAGLVAERMMEQASTGKRSSRK